MGVEECCEIPEDKRQAFIEERIVDALPEGCGSTSNDEVRERATNVVNNYVGQDLNALSVLMYAAEQGRFEEFVEELEKHYDRNLKYVPSEARRVKQMPGALRTEGFFLDCYEALGIKTEESPAKSEEYACQQRYRHARDKQEA